MSINNLRKGRISLAQAEYFITFNCIGRTAFFTQFELAHLFCRQLAIHESHSHCQWLTWVLMPDHFHGLLKLHNDNLHEAVGHLKGVTAAHINHYLGRRGKVWQSGYYDHRLRSEENRINTARYIVANPLRKRLVTQLGYYPYWNSVYL